MMRELVEMVDQWEVPSVLDDRQFRNALGATHTPADETVAATVAWAERRFGSCRVARLRAPA